MHAFEIPNQRFSLPSGEAVARRRFVSVNSDSEGVLATAAGSAIGVSMNQAAEGEALEIADGIVIVESGEAITAGADVQVGTSGKAITKTSGVGVGVALTSTTGTGQLVAVKLVSVSAADGADGANGQATQTIIYTSSNLAAGAELADQPIGVVVGDGDILAATVISTGSAAGVDDDNASEFVLEVGSTSKASKTFNTTTAFPAAGAAVDMTVASAAVTKGDVLLLSVTNGATADLPVFMVQVVVALD
jgi:hypothetical protein